MVPDPPSRAQGCQTRSQVRPWKINNKPQGFPGAPVNQVFAVLFQQPKIQHRTSDRREITKSRNMEKFSFI